MSLLTIYDNSYHLHEVSYQEISSIYTEAIGDWFIKLILLGLLIMKLN